LAQAKAATELEEGKSLLVWGKREKGRALLEEPLLEIHLVPVHIHPSLEPMLVLVPASQSLCLEVALE
jgi:hypothetical protein